MGKWRPGLKPPPRPEELDAYLAKTQPKTNQPEEQRFWAIVRINGQPSAVPIDVAAKAGHVIVCTVYANSKEAAVSKASPYL